VCPDGDFRITVPSVTSLSYRFEILPRHSILVAIIGNDTGKVGQVGQVVLALAGVLVGVAVYFVPTIIAHRRHSPLAATVRRGADQPTGTSATATPRTASPTTLPMPFRSATTAELNDQCISSRK
jgi:hypothetical protein